MMSNYTGNHTGHAPGIIPGSSFWTGAQVFSTLMQYWYFTGDTSNNPTVEQGMYWQKGADDNYMPANSTTTMGNDDQVYWGLAAMTAAELDFPASNEEPSWTSLARNVFDTLAARWDTDSCDGGLRSQNFPFKMSYNFKSAMANGGFFELSARLARKTGNETYSAWAEKVWGWSTTVGVLDNQTWTIADGASVEDQCSQLGAYQWSVNYASYLSGAAYMYNLVGCFYRPCSDAVSHWLTIWMFQTNGDTKWKAGVDGLLNTSRTTFFPKKQGNGNIMVEVTCESVAACDSDQGLFKGALASSLAFTSLVAPYTASRIMPKLESTAEGAAKQCSGGANGTLCGQRWYEETWDGTSSLQREVSATSLFVSNLVHHPEVIMKSSANDSAGGNETSDQPGGDENGSGHLVVSGVMIGMVLAGFMGVV